MTHNQGFSEADRARLVRLCARLSGSASAAEDLAQETMLVAWRCRDRLTDPTGADRWLAAIARNVCRRWTHAQVRETARLARAASFVASDVPDETGDPQRELDRTELAELVRQALALLPDETRSTLLARHVEELSHRDIGVRLGVSPDAAAMRVSRGAMRLRHVLETTLRLDAEPHGLIASEVRWRATDAWCTDCGATRLLMTSAPSSASIAFRCPSCSPAPGAVASAFALSNPSFARLFGPVTRPSAILGRAASWSHGYFADGVRTGAVRCTRCGRDVPLRQRQSPADEHGRTRRGVYAHCSWCAETVSSSLGGLALGQPAVRRFRRVHPRLHALPEHVGEVDGRSATTVSYGAVLGSAVAHVSFDSSSLVVLDVRICD